MSTIKLAFFHFIDTLISNGYAKEAYEILGETTTLSPPPQRSIPGKLMPDYSVSQKPTPKEKQSPPPPSSFINKPGGAASIIELSRIIDDIKKDSTFMGLPDKLQKGILKVEKMTENAFRFASEKEAFIRNEDSLKILKKTLNKFGPSVKNLPEDVIKALSNLHQTIDTEIEKITPEKNLFEKGMDLGKEITKGLKGEGEKLKQNITEKGKEFLEERRQRKERDIELDRRTQDNEKKFTEILKTKLLRHPVYTKIFYNLPPQIIKALNEIGLGIDNLKKIEKESFSIKNAHMVGNVMIRYLNEKDAYSNNELSMGKKEEKEHSDLYNKFKKFLIEKNIKMPINMDEFTEDIAKAHLNEDPEYYTKLKKTFKSAMDFSGISNMITPEGKLDDREISRVIRLAIAAELDAVHLYELIVDSSDDDSVKEVLQDIANEEKVHASELNELLSHFDKDNIKFIEEGKKEVKDLIQ